MACTRPEAVLRAKQERSFRRLGQRIAALGLAGLDQGPDLADPSASVGDSILFTYDDRFGTATAGVVVNGQGHPAPAMPADPPRHIRAVRDASWKNCVYFPRDGSALKYGLGNLDDDPGEMRNLAFAPTTGIAQAQRERARLHAELIRQLVAN